MSPRINLQLFPRFHFIAKNKRHNSTDVCSAYLIPADSNSFWEQLTILSIIQLTRSFSDSLLVSIVSNKPAQH